MHSVMEISDNCVAVVERDDNIAVVDENEVVATWSPKDQRAVDAAHKYADGYAEAKENYS